MNRTCLFLLFLVSAWLAPLAPAAAQQKAVTSDGRPVYLFDDGTWRWADALDLSSIKVKVLAAPPWSRRLAQGSSAKTRLRLRQVSASPNKITDDEAWFRANNLVLPGCKVPNPMMGQKGDCPPRTPTSFRGGKLVSALGVSDRMLLTYGKDFSSGRYLIIADKALKQVEAALDFSAYARGPADKAGDRRFTFQQVNWATVADGVLYVSTGHRTYASSSGGRNAYLTALDLGSGALLWRSRPLVCNAQNFLLLEDAMVCGYGFTAEPDYLFVLDRASGKVVQRLKLKTGPSYIMRQKDRLLVRTYNMDYVFKISGTKANKARQQVAGE